MSTTFDESFITQMPTSFKYDPTPPSPSKDDLGNTIYSPNSITQTYTLRKYKKPRQLKLRSIGSPAKSSFAFPIIGTNGQKTTYSSLPQSSASLTDATKDNLINTQIKPGFIACDADPNCWGIGIQNPTDPVTGFNGTYTFNYYSKPDSLSTPSANTDPIELLECDFTNTWYTFIKNTTGAINPAGPTECIPPSVATVSNTTPTDAPSAPYTCPPDISNMPTSTPHYYVCLKQQTPPPVVSIWQKPMTWIIISVVVLLVGGVGYYFWRKRQSETDSIDYSKFLKKNKGGYYFLT
jgi:hypothetical protein